MQFLRLMVVSAQRSTMLPPSLSDASTQSIHATKASLQPPPFMNRQNPHSPSSSSSPSFTSSAPGAAGSGAGSCGASSWPAADGALDVEDSFARSGCCAAGSGDAIAVYAGCCAGEVSLGFGSCARWRAELLGEEEEAEKTAPPVEHVELVLVSEIPCGPVGRGLVISHFKRNTSAAQPMNDGPIGGG
ncbi:hypothetical protein EJB05_14941, partial [Eragrostis curvula]